MQAFESKKINKQISARCFCTLPQLGHGSTSICYNKSSCARYSRLSARRAHCRFINVRAIITRKKNKQELWLALKQPSDQYQRDAPATLHFAIGQKCGQRLSRRVARRAPPCDVLRRRPREPPGSNKTPHRADQRRRQEERARARA